MAVGLLVLFRSSIPLKFVIIMHLCDLSMGIAIVHQFAAKTGECHVDLKRDTGHLISLLNVLQNKYV